MAQQYQNTAYGRALRERDAQNRSDFWRKAILPAVGFAAGPAIAGAVGSSGAAAGGSGYVRDAVMGAASRFAPAAGGGVPWLKVGELAAGSFGNIYATKVNNRANDRALAVQERANAEAMAYEREQDAERRRQFDIQQADLRRQWEAQQKFEADKWAALEEERLYDRRLKDEREARRAPYRAASAAALDRVNAMLGGSIGSYRRA